MSAKKQMIGTRIYWYGSSIITQTAVYDNDSEGDIIQRALDGLRMLNRDMLPYFYSATPKFIPIGQ